MAKPPLPWHKEIIAYIKSRGYSTGWTLYPKAGKVCLKFHKATTVMPYEFDLAAAQQVKAVVVSILDRMAEGVDFKAAAKDSLKGVRQGRATADVIHEELCAEFMEQYETSVRDSTRANSYVPKLRTFGELFSDDKITNASQAHQRLLRHIEDTNAPGKDGRKRWNSVFCNYCNFVAKTCNNPLWIPPDKKRQDKFIGYLEDRNPLTKTPVMDHEIDSLFKELVAAEQKDVLFTVGLVALFGLRPSELACFNVDQGNLRVANIIKQNHKTRNQRATWRTVPPMTTPALKGWVEMIMLLWTTRDAKFPPAIQKAIQKSGPQVGYAEVGKQFSLMLGHKLDRQCSVKAWRKLLMVNPDLTPYSFRHGYAYRGTKLRFDYREMAGFMGHLPSTHLKDYGSYYDTNAALNRANQINTGSVSNPAAPLAA